jgi:hypothetical protein
MLTNMHVAYMKSFKENLIRSEIEISQRQKGPDGKYTKLFTTKGEVVEKANKTSNEDKRTEDLVVVRLDEPSPDKGAVIPTCDMKVVAASRSKAVSLATYLPAEKPYGHILRGQESCKIYGNVNDPGGPWKTDCPSLDGTSGTPALITITDGPNKGKLCSPGIIQGDFGLGII